MSTIPQHKPIYLQKYGSSGSFKHFNVNKGTNKNNPKPINITSLIPAFSTPFCLKALRNINWYSNTSNILTVFRLLLLFYGKEITGKLFLYIIFIPFSNVTRCRSWCWDLLPQESGYRSEEKEEYIYIRTAILECDTE